MRHVRSYILWLGLLCISLKTTAQTPVADTATNKCIAAGPVYKRPHFYQWLWGRNHRIEWATPVCVPVLLLDTAFGRLIPYKVGGGNESKSLRLRTKEGKEYALRSINKSRKEVIPPRVKGTFLEDMVNDGISMSYPYGAFAVSNMMQHAGIYHTIPTLVYLPQQKALDTFNARFGNDLYLLEQKPEGDWREADNLGNFKTFLSTEEVLVKLQQNNTYTVDQHAFARARLFDMLIGDWDRHEGNWSWGEVPTPNGIQLRPVPRDRDQAFFYHNGVIINKVIQGSGLSFMQHFNYRLKDVDLLNSSARSMDRFFTNALTLTDWVYEAEDLKKALTDSVIVQSVRQLPPEIFAIKGQVLIDKLRSRRDQLPKFAKEYYRFIAKQVEITGTRQQEYFEVSGADNNETSVTVFHINENGQKAATPYYNRIFNPAETKEIRLFGIKGEDVYVVNNDRNNITIRIIGGDGKDSIVQKNHKVYVYDDTNNVFQTSSARRHLSSDTSIHNWEYKWFKYDKSGIRPEAFYNNADRIFVGLRYRYRKYKWRQDPFAWEQQFGVRYSLSQNALSFYWSAVYPHVLGQWNLVMRADYDVIRWTNFYGTGNETKSVTTNVNYYRLQSEEWYAAAGLNRNFGRSNVAVTGYYARTQGKNDPERYPSKVFTNNDDLFKANPYAGLQLTYSYVHVKDSVTPESGYTFLANAVYANNFLQKEFYQQYNAHAQLYVPIIDHVSLAIRAGAETIVNNDVLGTGQAYEHAIIGGPRFLRGFRRERFWGKTAFYNSNELRFITNFRSYIMNGKIGVFAFFDQGRVWLPGERSNKMHVSYGPGIILAPFNKYNLSATYGITEEIRLVQLRLNHTF
ncbi:hypothetical protein Niako_5930 [Niastella koreensis GR20-10]|uniref:Surface antigen (D15) n=1 Tax=Niastella koreensis (strain DSM 17620 / KACC 11465 / NBRC 106392 / GR20-10) TaxID=700598 RepID=G8TRL3_NIAKG|nr:hypothetical protein [Niastella koreensis]AEW02160.1 hypothetical protein Niako_5930 [Niastella koreensis GR20-10]